MGLFDKLKNVLFEDDEETSEIPVIEKKEVKKEEEVISEPRFKSTPSVEKKEEEEDVPKRTSDLDNSNEKPIFQSFDEEEFDRIAAINRNRLLERDRKAREKKEMERKLEEARKSEVSYETSESRVVRRDTHVERRPSYSYRETPKEEVRTHKFKPSPVISPVYGILDKNYKKEDILPRASSDGTLPKVMDVDNVRRKAFGILEEEIAKNDPLKNFQGEKKEEPISKELVEDSLNVDEKIQPLDRIEEPVISFEDDINDFKVEDEIDSKKDSNSYDKAREDRLTASDDTLESDLFNLIDSMYDNREDK